MTRPAWAGLAVSAALAATALAGLAGVGVSNEPSAIGAAPVARTVTVKKVRRAPLATSCNAVVHIGDSTSEGLVSKSYLPDPKQRISARYARVGATTQHFEIAGARSIYENFEGEPNAQEVAEAWRNEGFKGCWVLAMGTNEAANVAVGSNFTYDDRIDSMMSTIGEQPVLWVNVKSPDGIHFTSPGYAARSRLIADALLEAFPNSHPLAMTDKRDCLVSPPS